MNVSMYVLIYLDLSNAETAKDLDTHSNTAKAQKYATIVRNPTPQTTKIVPIQSPAQIVNTTPTFKTITPHSTNNAQHSSNRKKS